MKICSKCGAEKPLVEFSRHPTAKSGVRPECKPCRAEQSRLWKLANLEKARASVQNCYYADVEASRAKSREKMRKWREDNPELHRERTLRANKLYRERHPDRVEEHRQRRRARLAGVAYEHISRAELYARDEGTCRICLKPVPEKGWEMDHIVPLALGGPHLWSNVQVTHRTCNRKKWKRLEGQIALPA